MWLEHTADNICLGSARRPMIVGGECTDDIGLVLMIFASRHIRTGVVSEYDGW
jgi:hypothetical protein